LPQALQTLLVSNTISVGASGYQFSDFTVAILGLLSNKRSSKADKKDTNDDKLCWYKFNLGIDRWH
jgi:hypothetical protein